MVLEVHAFTHTNLIVPDSVHFRHIWQSNPANRVTLTHCVTHVCLIFASTIFDSDKLFKKAFFHWSFA